MKSDGGQDQGGSYEKVRNGQILYVFQRIDVPVYIDQLDVRYVRKRVRDDSKVWDLGSWKDIVTIHCFDKYCGEKIVGGKEIKILK